MSGDIQPNVKSGKRSGKGFSIEELNQAGLSIESAKKKSLPIDKRRKTGYEENIKILKYLLQEMGG